MQEHVIIVPEQFRKRLDERRRGVTEILTYRKSKPGELKIVATFNWREGGRVEEVFCLAFKEGSDMQVALHHSCIALSLGLQFGATMADFAHAMAEEDREEMPSSLVGLIVRAGVTIDEQRGFVRPAQGPERPAT